MDQDETEGPGAATESGTARARRLLIEPLSGLARPRRVSAEQHAENLARLARKLSYMDEAALRGLAELCLAHAGQVARSKGAVAPVCPEPGMIQSWAFALQAPPIGQSDYPASVMRSAMGRRAHDQGFGVELLRMARRYGPPPQAYTLTRLRDEADENRRRRAALRAEIEAGNRLAPEQARWLEAWHADAALVEQLIAEGDERREARGAA
jgi:hypothetical protein